jgi:hypothetical protein
VTTRAGLAEIPDRTTTDTTIHRPNTVNSAVSLLALKERTRVLVAPHPSPSAMRASNGLCSPGLAAVRLIYLATNKKK